MLGSSRRKETVLWLSQKHLELAGENIISLTHIAKGELLHGVSAIPAKSILQTIGKNLFKKFRLSRVTHPSVNERETKGPILEIIQQGGQIRRSPSVLSCEQLGSCAGFVEASVEFARNKAWELLKNTHKVKGICVK